MTTYTDAAVLLRAILEQPADDAPRLAYADELEGNGYSEHAEFIKRQIELRDWDNACCGIDGCYSFVHRHLSPDLCAMFGERDLHKRAIFRRGFICEIHGTMSDLMQHAETLFRSHPITRVVVTDRKPHGQDNSFWWAKKSLLVKGDKSENIIDDEVFDRLEKYTRQGGAGGFVFYDSREDATDEFYRAFVAYGRSLAGLSPRTDVDNLQPTT